jgi:hypothetical protein
LWVVARAAVQSITIDEADTYLVFAGRSAPSHWAAAANNHMLNSMLMRLFTSLFGVYHLTVRLPALIGAAVYIGAAWVLARGIGRSGWLSWATFVCLTFNPFVMDHLVAARGYSLALGFLLLAIACGGLSGLPYVSICLALSFASNFSFALADAAVMLFILLWHCSEVRTVRERRKSRRRASSRGSWWRQSSPDRRCWRGRAASSRGARPRWPECCAASAAMRSTA